MNESTPPFPLVQGLVAAGDHARLRGLALGGEAPATRACAALGAALTAPGTGEELLRTAWSWLSAARTSLPAGLREWEPMALSAGSARIGRLLAHVTPDDASALTLAVALRLLDGEQPTEGPTASVQVLLSTGDSCVQGRLTVRLHPRLPAGLLPDPRSMFACTADQRFQDMLAAAWDPTGGRFTGALLWSVETGAGPADRIEGDSLGLAFTTVLDELRRASARLHSVRHARLLDPESFVVGALTATGAATSVAETSGADRPARIILPAGELAAAQRSVSEQVTLVPAATWREAADRARRVDPAVRRRQRLIAAAVAVVLAAGGTGATMAVREYREHDAKQRRALAEKLASRSLGMNGNDPRAALLALAANDVDPAVPAVASALNSAAEANRRVVTTIKVANAPLVAAVQNGRDTLYTASADGRLSAWNLRTGRALGSLRVPGAVPVRLAVHPTLPLLFGADRGGGVWTWRTDGPANLADGSPLGAPETPAASGADREPSRAVGLGFSGERVYAISSSGRVRAWDATTRQPVLDVAPGGFTGVSWRENDRAVAVTDTNAAWPGALPGGSVLVATGSGRVLDLDLDRRRAQEVVPAGRLAEPITALSVREFPRGDVLAVGTGRGLQLWNLAKHRQEASPIPDASPVLGVRFSPTLTNLLVSSTDRVSIVGTSPDGGHDLDQPEPLASDTGGPATLVADGATPNGLIAVGHANGRMTVIDPVDGGGTALTPLDASTVVAFGSSGRLLVTDTVSSSRVEGLHTVTIPKGAPDTAYRTAQSLSPDPQWWSGGNFYVNDAVHADNLILVAGQASSQEERYPHGAVMVWDTRTGEPLRELDFPGGNPDLVSAVRYLPAAALIAARNTEGALRVWSTRTWQRVLDRTVGRGGTMTVIPDTATAVLPVLADPGGERPAQAKGALAFVDLRTGRTRNVELDVPVDRVAASPRGDYIVVAGAGGRVRYLEPDGSTKKGFPAITLPSTVSGVAVDPRGERVAFALANGRVMVYLAATGALAVPPFVEPDGEVPVRLSWHPDGDLLAIAGLTYQGDDPIAKPVRLWRSRSTSWRDRLCGIAGRNLTRQEWHRHVGDGTPYRRLCARFG